MCQIGQKFIKPRPNNEKPINLGEIISFGFWLLKQINRFFSVQKVEVLK